jgi:ribosomal protein S18 acetylase RimI-like enzyme
MPPWQIRDARPRDAEGIAVVHARAWEAAYRGLLSDEVIRAHARKRRRWWASYLKQPREREEMLLAVEDDRIVGFASARPSPDEDAEADQAEVGGLYVEPDAWGRGIGGTLLDALLARLRADGFKSATLWVLVENAAARGFYEGRDWILDGAQRVDPDRGAPELRYRISLSRREHERY